MTVGTVVLWRHGRTAYNAEARLQGQVDIPLDEVGRWQVERAAALLARQHPPARIVSSDLGRAQATARALAELAEVEVQVDERLRERAFGEWEGLSAEEIAARWPEEHAVWRRGEDPARAGAETRAAVAERFVNAIEEHVADTSGTLVVVSHGAAITLGLTSLMGLDPTTWRGLVGLHNAHWAMLRASSGSAGHQPAWRLGGHNLGPAVQLADWDAGVPSESLPSSAADAMRV